MKYNKLLFCIVVILLCILFVSCGNKEKKIKDALANEIINAYAKQNNLNSEDLRIDYYFGKYKKYHVVYINKDADSFVNRHIKIGDYTFMYSVNKALEVYKDGKFYTLGDVYQNEYIKDRHLKKIYKQTDLFLDKILYSYNDALKAMGLSEEVYNKIFNLHKKDRIIDYYGEYSGLDVVALESFKTEKEYTYVMDIMWDQSKYDMIRAVSDEKMYTLEEAYNDKKLSLEEIVEIFQVVYGYIPYMIIGQTGEEMTKHASYALVNSYYNEFYSKENSSLELFDLWEKYNQNVYCYLYNSLRIVWLYTEGKSDGKSYIINVGGYDFELNNNQTILVYFGNQHYTLGKAYDEGLISENDMEIVHLSSTSK